MVLPSSSRASYSSRYSPSHALATYAFRFFSASLFYSSWLVASSSACTWISVFSRLSNSLICARCRQISRGCLLILDLRHDCSALMRATSAWSSSVENGNGWAGQVVRRERRVDIVVPMPLGYALGPDRRWVILAAVAKPDRDIS